MQWCREILIDLFQVGFRHVTPYAANKIRMFQQALRTSLPSELGGNRVKGRQTAHVSGKLAKVERWHSLLTSPIMADHERPAAQITPAAERMRPTKLEDDYFEVGKWEHSLGAAFDRLRGEADWLATTHEQRQLCFVSWASFVQLKGNWNDHLLLWNSLLPVVGHLLYNDDTKEGGRYVIIV